MIKNIKEIKIPLRTDLFHAHETLILEFDHFHASLFQFPTGVCGLRIQNEKGDIVLLPFQGQQIWSMCFNGRNLGMQSMVKYPLGTNDFLSNFGGILQHCGVTGVGSPSKEDTHPLHGELPNAKYQKAEVVAGIDDNGKYIGLQGEYYHGVAFQHSYLASPRVKLYDDATCIHVEMTITNQKNTPMEYLYLAHINFKPINNAEIIYSAHYDPEHVRVRSSIPAHIHPGEGYKEFIDVLRRNPEIHHLLKPGLPFDPEAVFFIDYLADDNGWAYSLQIHPDGQADYLKHRQDLLPKATRWISRTLDQDAIALAEPGTAEPEGYLAEKQKGNIRILQPGEKYYCEFEFGCLSPDEVPLWKDIIEKIKK